MDDNQTSAQREHDKNVSVFVSSMCITQRKIVSNIFMCNLIICISSGKYRKKIFSVKFLKTTTYLTWLLPKIDIIYHCESHYKLVSSTLIFLWCIIEVSFYT